MKIVSNSSPLTKKKIRISEELYEHALELAHEVEKK